MFNIHSIDADNDIMLNIICYTLRYTWLKFAQVWHKNWIFEFSVSFVLI